MMEPSRTVSLSDDASTWVIVLHRPMVALGEGQHCVSCRYHEGTSNLRMGERAASANPKYPTLSLYFTDLDLLKSLES